jgi:small conductance mechanosensitive channel
MNEEVQEVVDLVGTVKKQLVQHGIAYGLQIFGAVVILVIGFVCARLVGRFVDQSLRRTQLEAHLRLLLVRVSKGLVLLFTAVVCLDKFGVQVTALVAGISVAGVAGGFALHGVLGNIAAGISIMFSKYFKIGEYIEIGSTRGQVEAIQLSMTILRTLEDARVIVPNRKIVGEIIFNYGAERSVPLTVEVAYREDLDKAIRTVHEVLAASPRVLQGRPPQVGITKLGESGIEITMRPWCKAEDYWDVHFEIYRAIVDRFRTLQIEIPYPQREVRLLSAPA